LFNNSSNFRLFSAFNARKALNPPKPTASKTLALN